MGPSGRRRSIILVAIFGICMVAVAIGLNIGWIVINWRAGLMLVLGILLFAMLIAGVALNTIFLIREIRRNERHDSFINSVTHELKTPVASIRLYLETLKTREPEPGKRKEFYDVMLADTERLMGTIEQVLQAGRTGSAPRLTHKSPLDLASLVQDCVAVARLRHHLPEGALHLAAEPGSWVEGDPEELKAAVSNLLDNAIKYSSGSVRIRAEVSSAHDGKVAVRVRDEGVGIPDHEMKRIFKRFYRIPGTITQKVKGTGLGLFIVNAIAKRHGGRVYAESPGAGHGSTFTIELPIADPQRFHS